MYLIYAPIVRAGGGLVLLQALLMNWTGRPELRAVLDERALSELNIPAGIAVDWAPSGLLGRLRTEWRLKAAARDVDCILCFHGLPPFFVGRRVRPRIVVLVQNRLIIKRGSLRDYPILTRLRLLFERFLLRGRASSINDIIVQSRSMESDLSAVLSQRTGLPRVHVRPFAAVDLIDAPSSSERRYDFIYPATGEPHKNHNRLLEAWECLAQEGLKPSLALTLGSQDEKLWNRLRVRAAGKGLCVTNLGTVSRPLMGKAYGQARALIFPSTKESFGLPLVEARFLRLPILASELDYVRDVCDPHETFDPDSAASIARAVKRYLGQKENRVAIETPEAFWNALTADHSQS
jgi:glycosyltransferase involved in cell wall biosynthesis